MHKAPHALQFKGEAQGPATLWGGILGRESWGRLSEGWGGGGPVLSHGGEGQTAGEGGGPVLRVSGKEEAGVVPAQKRALCLCMSHDWTATREGLDCIKSVGFFFSKFWFCQKIGFLKNKEKQSKQKEIKGEHRREEEK